MSALGQKQTGAAHKPMSALPPIADIKAVTSQPKVKQQRRAFSGVFEVGGGGLFWENLSGEGPVHAGSGGQCDCKLSQNDSPV